jgi:4a-hydroxytetrahydrobiopterin dehydratase
MSKRLSEQDLAAALRSLPSWKIADGKLFRELTFPDFVAAFAEMTRIALAAQTRDHHPEWWNSYRTVRVWLTTHDAGGISAKDVELARVIGA